MYPPFGPILLHLGSLTIRWYGIFQMTGIALGAWLAGKYVEKKGYNSETIWNMLLWIVIPAIIGARLYFVFIQTPWTASGVGYYLSNPGQILAVWNGGIHIFGAIIAGAIALIWYTRRNKLPIPIYLDAVAFVLPLAQGIVRWANFINQELYGPPTTLPWGLRISADDPRDPLNPNHRVPPYDDLVKYPDSTRFHPLFLYESLWNLSGFVLLVYLLRRYPRWFKPGDIFFMYMIWYPTIRFILEFFRTDSWFFPVIHMNLVHIICLLLITIGALTLYLRHRPQPVQADAFTHFVSSWDQLVQRMPPALRDVVDAFAEQTTPSSTLLAQPAPITSMQKPGSTQSIPQSSSTSPIIRTRTRPRKRS